MMTKDNFPKKEIIEGVWIGISHQTITVTACSSNGTFSGTYFTPSLDVRSTFSGDWSLDKDVLTLSHTAADSPIFHVPIEDMNRVEALSNDSLILHTLPKGISLKWDRIQFSEHWSKIKSKVDPVAPPTNEQLTILVADDLINTYVLLTWISFLIDSSKEEMWDDKMVDALKNKIPKKAGYYFAMFQFEGLWGNGGMQHVLIREELEQTQYFLSVVAAGYDYFRGPKTAALVRKLAAKTKQWMAEIMKLDEKDAPDHKYQTIWEEIDAYDDIYDKLSENESDCYNILLKDIHNNPQDYTITE